MHHPGASRLIIPEESDNFPFYRPPPPCNTDKVLEEGGDSVDVFFRGIFLLFFFLIDLKIGRWILNAEGLKSEIFSLWNKVEFFFAMLSMKVFFCSWKRLFIIYKMKHINDRYCICICTNNSENEDNLKNMKTKSFSLEFLSLSSEGGNIENESSSSGFQPITIYIFTFHYSSIIIYVYWFSCVKKCNTS